MPYTERQSISTERTFDRDTTDDKKLRSILVAMAENLAFQLRRGHKLTGCVAVKIRYSDFQTYTQQQKIAYSAADHNIIPTVMALYEKLYQRRMLVRLIGVRLSDLVAGGHQIDLFNDAEKTIKLYQAIDLMRERYGDRSIMRAVGMEAQPSAGSTHLMVSPLPCWQTVSSKGTRDKNTAGCRGDSHHTMKSLHNPRTGNWRAD